ncbi:hypothetical protein GCM10010170_078020 [Dactylosporangium salmoneum]|uniref:Fibronectin type-III domain-containing protein n=1 Tax=Dactylosporangium salmoneum TaxID=53361 RepID=A0ABN3HB71_9ACTN
MTITGTGFTGATAVTFDGTAATSFTVVSPTRITAVTPAGTAGSALVQVAIGTCVSPAGGGTFTYLPPVVTPTPPVVTPTPPVVIPTPPIVIPTPPIVIPLPPIASSMSPTSGPTAGGATVTITGVNLAGTTSVTFDGVTGSVSNSTATSITVVTPPHVAGNVPVGVNTVMGGTSVTGGYTYVAPPSVTSLSPASGSTSGEDTVTITGTGFTGATAVTFGAGALFTVDSDTQITALTPTHTAGPVDVAVTTPNGSATAAGAYTYVAPPSITSVSPTSGSTAGGTSVTITGTGFTGATLVRFGGTAAGPIVVNSDTSITASTPAHAAGTVGLEVTGPGGTDLMIAAYTYVAAPTAMGMSPTFGPDFGGTSVTIMGTGFTGATGVQFGILDAASFTVNSSTQITAVTPPGVWGVVPVTVTTPGGMANVPGDFEYVPVQAANLAAHAAHRDAAPEPAKARASGKADKADHAKRSAKADGKAKSKADGKAKSKADGKAKSKADGKAKSKADGKVKTTAKAKDTDKHGSDATAAPRMKKVFFQMPASLCPAPPSAPSPVTATAGTSSINVSWTAATPHDSPVTGYTVTATPGPATCTTLVTDPDPLSCVLGATAGQQYTVSVVANSAAGASDPATSSAVTPAAPVAPAAPPDTPLNLTTDKGLISTAAPGQDIVVIGTGFAAHSTATITLYSTPLVLGTVVTDGNGDFSKPVTVPPSLAAGVHTLVAQGVAPSGSPRSMKLTVTVAASAPRPATGGGLPVTGAPAGPLALAGLAMVLAGFGLLRPWQRRTVPGLR